MKEPIFWLGLSILLVAVSLTALLVAALPALQELARAARSAEKLFDTLNRELPSTLEAIRLTGMEISDLTDEVNEGVKSASQVVKQVDRSVSGAKKQAQKAQVTTRSLFAGVRAAWQTWKRPSSGRRDRLPPGRNALEVRHSRISASETAAEGLGFPQNDDIAESLSTSSPETLRDRQGRSDRASLYANSTSTSSQRYEDEEDLDYSEDDFPRLTQEDESTEL